MSEHNKELNKLEQYKNKECEKCCRRYPDTILDIEGWIHHGVKQIQCIERKSCERLKRKIERKQ